MEKLFKTNVSNDCSNKIYSIDCELNFFNERELLEKTVDELIEEWLEIYKYKDLPIIDFDNPYVCEEPIVGRTSTSINIYIPLIGPYDSLCYQPHNQCLFGSNYEAEIDNKNNRLLMSLSLPNKPDMDIDSLIEAAILKRKKNIVLQYDYLKKDIELYNNSIKGHLKGRFEDLYKKVKIQIEIEQKTKKSKYLRIEPKPITPIKLEEKTIETKTNIKNIVDSNPEKILALEKDSYLQIYNNLKELSIYAQRTPKSYNKLDEEENRDQLINALNLKLKTASASGETFNVRGKSDIIIIDNKVIYYIAECKIWNGTKKFEEAITQLLSYISSDIFYSSLIIFNKKNKSVIEDATKTITVHPSFIEQITPDRFKFKHPNRNNCNLEISLICFNVFYKD